MNKLMEAHKRKLSPQQSIVTAIEGLADELYEMRKENRDLQGELRNIAGSLDYVSQYLYDISWELKKNSGIARDTSRWRPYLMVPMSKC